MISSGKIKLFFIIICFLQIFYIFQFRSGFEYEVLKNAFRKDVGIINVLPSEAIDIKKIVRELNIGQFNLSDSIIEDDYLFQRIIEYNYPIRFNINSNFIFLLKNEENINLCKVIKLTSHIKLFECPND
tara:strand:+ start:68 stop:454 length:387 start_codon:yes stop_codon:yes gene_type:complete